MARIRLRGQRRNRGEQGQSLIETALGLPLMLGIAFNIINFGYFWFLVLTLSAAPRMGAQYATQGGAAGTAVAAPGTVAISNLVYDNLTNAIGGATISNAAVQVCTSALGVSGSGPSQVAQCQTFGSYASPPPPVADPEAPVFVLDRVDVKYTVTPIIPGGAFNVFLPPNLKFHRQISMRSLY
jgi:Flp pilus assembly protein TadG